MDEKRIRKYAELLIGTGLNVQKGQALVVSAPVDAAPFVRECVAAAYRAGCRDVNLRWNDDFIARETYLHAADDTFDRVRPWKSEMLNTLASECAAFLSIYSEDPESLAGVDPDRIRRATASFGAAIKPYRERMTADYCPWCVASVPNAAWAKKVFPGVPQDEAAEKLWEAILEAVSVTEDNDPAAVWAAHNAELRARVDKLNALDFKYLKYKSSLGTDLTVRLPETHFWDGGSSVAGNHVRFNANMPTEEVFTAPDRRGTEGVAFAAKPLVLNGGIVDHFSLTFEHGRIVKVHAERGQELLETGIAVDEGAAYLGEAALVPYDSPISRSGILFYNTLFDENAACHLAFGDSYPCIRGGAAMTKEQRLEFGLNSSIVHEDFMIGTPDLSITGVTHDGKEVPVFREGNFAL